MGATYNELSVTKRNGSLEQLDLEKIRSCFVRAAYDCMDNVSIDMLIAEVVRNVYDKVKTEEVESALILSAVAFIEQDPAYDKVATRLLLQKLYREVLGQSVNPATLEHEYRNAFIKSIYQGVKGDVLNQKLLEFDLERLANGLHIERDHLFVYLGLSTLYERYFYKIEKKRYELPQTFWMRVAMGLALNETNKEEKALEFYETFSSLRYVSSTPTLFHSGYKIAQLSSCYLSTVNDDLGHIFKVIGDNAQLSKWAGGIGNDWTNIRGTGSFIKSIHATSQGVIPYLKIVNDVVIAITRSGIRRGGTCSYLETWHIDVEDFIDLRRNTGDERRRTHDMNTANWIPDLFMKRVMLDADWTLFSPDEVPDLHDLYGRAFEKRYEEYEEKARAGQIKLSKVVSAQKLWRRMLSRLFETGHPWITFKDPCNIRSPQDHVGVVHSSNLCTEITLNTSAEETAVCNLGSINLSEHIINGQLDVEMLAKSIRTAVRMLDNVLDLNFYPTAEARSSNLRHRPIGLGVMGFQDALIKLDIGFASEKAIWFADYSQELISYYAILSSSELAHERGAYQTYKGSKWDRGIFPIDSIDLLEQERGMRIEVSRSATLDWSLVRENVRKHGMRNSNVMAVAPTATIANIAGCYPSIEPLYKNMYVKSNIAGEFTIVNRYLVNDLKKIGAWNRQMLEQLKYYDGDITRVPSIPEHLKEKYRGAFELDPVWLLKITAARGKWIDQSQSHNVFMKGVSGKKLNDIYMTAWQYGLKTTYYLRTLGATQIEKSTLGTEYGFTQKREYNDDVADANAIKAQAVEQEAPKTGASCNPFDNAECESCQ
ncbi:ribonucleoside-diphosphate reductase subunit alpha [Candidatus Dependentiae bacterium]|nr:ribonucleoside-diphosphate reductase subunit alpha [Candidatus Dependentiae bacterium]